MSGTALGAAAVAMSAAATRKAEEAACIATVQGYEHDTASIAQRQAYAECVERLHPSPLAPDMQLAIKALIVVVLIGMVVGAWLHRNRWEGPVTGALVGAVSALGAVFLLAMVAFLFS